MVADDLSTHEALLDLSPRAFSVAYPALNAAGRPTCMFGVMHGASDEFGIRCFEELIT